jgi:L-gulonolactone oxidase
MYTPDFEWSNWMGNLAATMDLFEPRTEAQLQDAVVRAVARGKVRAVGGSNAWSPLVPTTPSGGGAIFSLRHLRGVKRVDAVSATPTITVESGWPVKRLVKYSEKHGLTLITPTIFQEITLGGALAVGAHGTGLGWATMSDAVESLKLVTPDGNTRTLTAADGDLFDAALVGLGCFCVVYEVTLRCEKTFRLHVEDRLLPRDEVLSGIDDLLATYEFLELYWFPFNDSMWVKAMSRTPEPGGSSSPTRRTTL